MNLIDDVKISQKKQVYFSDKLLTLLEARPGDNLLFFSDGGKIIIKIEKEKDRKTRLEQKYKS